MRAAVLVGVARTGGLPELQGVPRAVAAMEAWALGQGMSRDEVLTVVDSDGGSVTSAAVFSAVADLVSRGTLEQLVLYFAGHGVNNAQNELWLLSGAPENPNEAVNVSASAVLARRCGVPHVVVISDACRTAAAGITAQSVASGALVFPNRPPVPGQESRVDEFYACGLGDPAHEVADPALAAGAYRSIYTDVLVDALLGKRPEAISACDVQGDVILVRPWPLQDVLPKLVMQRMRDLGVALTVSQTPQARIGSRPDRDWLSRVPARAGSPRSSGARGPAEARGPARRGLRGVGDDAGADLAVVVRQTVLTGGARSSRAVRGRRPPESPGVAELRAAADAVREVGGDDLPTGFRIRGDSVLWAAAEGSKPSLTDVGQAIAVEVPAGGASSVLLGLDSGGCALVVARPDSVGTLTLDGGQLVDVAYRPTTGSAAWSRYATRADEVHDLHVSLASAARLGLLAALREVDAVVVRVLEVADLDPALLLFAGYAAFDAGRDDLVQQLHARSLSESGFGALDLAVLASASGQPLPRDPPPGLRVPLLSRTWALLPTAPRDLTDAVGVLARLPQRPSLWTLFDDQAADQLRTYLEEAQ